MERSAELEALLRRFFGAFADGDVETVLSMWDTEADVLWVGTDPDEWWSSQPMIDGVVRAQFREIGGAIPFRVKRVEAWQEGSVGWGCAGLTLDVDEPLDVRYTAVWHLRLGQWKMLHGHTSVAIGNTETLHQELTTSIELVAEAVAAERPDLTSVAAPDGTVTLLFTDIEGSTERNAAMGDQAWLELLQEHHRLVRAEVQAASGFEVKSMGDGFMIAFDSASRGVGCAVGLQRRLAASGIDVRVRAGLHSGEAVRVGDDFYGGVVNMAARVASSAHGGEVLVSAVVRALVDGSGDFRFDAPRPTELKGFDGLHDLYPVACL